MIADYAKDSMLYEECLTLIDSCFPGIKALADQGRSHQACWDDSSIPFIAREGSELVAHLGLLPFNLVIQGKPYYAAAIHGICTKEKCRRKGHFKNLMQEALKYIQQNFDFSFLFTDQPYLYEQFGFMVLAEYDFPYHFTAKHHGGKIRKIDLDEPNDLNLLQKLYFNRVPISNCFGIVKETTIATLNALHEPVYYIEAIEALIVYQIINNVLYLKDIITSKPCELDLVLSSIPDEFSKVVLQFSPDNFLKGPFESIIATPECCFMISKDFEIPCSSFRFPEPQRC